MKNILSQYFDWFKKTDKPKYRIVKENIYDEILLEVTPLYYIEKKSSMNWYQVGPKFEDYDKCIKYFAKMQEYIKNKELTYEYLK